MAADRQIHRGLLSQGGWESRGKGRREEGEEEGEEEEAGIAEVETSVRPIRNSDKRVTTTSAGLFTRISASDQSGVFSITEVPFFGGVSRVAST
jgi:hypothetical protein